MIPILNIGTALTSVLALAVFLRLHAVHQKNRDALIKNFSRAYLLLSLYFALQSLPALVLNSPVSVQIEYIVAMIVLYLTITALFLLSLEIAGKPQWKTPFLASMVLIIPLTTLLQILFFEGAILHTFGNFFYHWADVTPAWIQGMNGTIISGILVFNSVMFFRASSKLEEPWLQRRSVILGWGYFSFFLAALFWLLLTPVIFQKSFSLLTGLAAVLSSISGIVLVLSGVLTQKPQ